MELDKYLTPIEAAKILGVSRSAIYRRIKNTDLEYIKVSCRYLIHEDEVKKGSLSNIKPGAGNFERKKKEPPSFPPVTYKAGKNDGIIKNEVLDMRSKGLSYRKIAEKLNIMGIGNTKGGYWSVCSLHAYLKRYEAI